MAKKKKQDVYCQNFPGFIWTSSLFPDKLYDLEGHTYMTYT